MAVDVKKLIAAISPKIYAENAKEIEEIVKTPGPQGGYLNAAKIAQLKESQYMEFDEYNDKSVYYANLMKAPGLKNPIEQHELYYDAAGESLEPVYFWLLDTMARDTSRIDKLVDNFVSAVGSSHFSEMGQKMKIMQEEGIKLIGTANQVIKTILSLLYDLKEFKMRLAIYNNLEKGKNEEKHSALLSLKQIWMDTVDMKRGQGSINALASGNLQFATLRDAFMAVEDEKAVEKVDLNERTKRLLSQRIGEFRIWLKESKRELTNRFEIEKSYLKSQINTVKIYSQWAKPYLKAAMQLEQGLAPGLTTIGSAALVNAFNTTILELVLFGQYRYKLEEDINKQNLPKIISWDKTQNKRKYHPIIIVELHFRSIPERMQQGGYGHRGRVEAKFTSFALNDDEIKILKEEVERDDMGDLFKAVEGQTDDSLFHIQEDLKKIFEEDFEGKSAPAEEKKSNKDTNPFSSLFELINFKREKANTSKESSKILPDNEVEKILRSQAIIKARDECAKLYEGYKKSHNMVSF
jgi:hypothetical protein